MLRRKVHFSFFAVFIFFSLTSSDHVAYNDGWIPITAEEVFSHIRRGSLQTTGSSENISDKIYADLSNKHSNKLLLQHLTTDYKTDEATKNQTNKSQNVIEIIFRNRRNKQNNEKDRIRTAKKIAEHILRQEVNKISLQDDYSPEEGVHKESINDRFYGTNDNSEVIDKLVTEDASNTYEVTEDLQKTTTTKDFDYNKHAGYQYNTPMMKNENLTAKFINILAKYNIKPNDELKNYELSRQGKSQLPLKQNYGFPVVPHNSPNHLLVDPLLAVFLSHYGVYLPGIYGVNGNYKNLYGYLASNNIHNNKPFGLYKIFSDTEAFGSSKLTTAMNA